MLGISVEQVFRQVLEFTASIDVLLFPWIIALHAVFLLEK